MKRTEVGFALQVWRIAFFGRLEERKGIKLFVDALTKLQKSSAVVTSDAFEIYIVGPEAVIDMARLCRAVPSGCVLDGRLGCWWVVVLTGSVCGCRCLPRSGWPHRQQNGG